MRLFGNKKRAAKGAGVQAGARVGARPEARDRRGISRRAFAAGTLAAGAGIAAISLVGCSSDSSESTTGDPQVVTDESQIIAVMDGDYENSDSTPAVSYAWTLPLGTMLFHTGGGSWAAALFTPASAGNANTLGVVSLATGNATTLLETPTQGTAYDFFDVRCSSGVYAWVEINYTDRSWLLLAQELSNGSLVGNAVKLDEGDADWEPPRFTAWESSVIWQKMPLATGSKSSSYSHCYRWTVGSDQGVEIRESHGRFATAPRVADGILTITPRVHEDEGTYYGMTAIDLADESFTQVDQLVLPRSVSPFDAVYLNEVFAFSIEASYNGVGSLGNMGTYIGREGGPYIYLRREPLAQVTARGSRYLVKSQASNILVDTEEQTFAVITAPDRSLDFGDWPATEGISDRFVTYATVRDETGVPASVSVRVFGL